MSANEDDGNEAGEGARRLPGPGETRRISILGATGSIGTSTVAVIDEHPQDFEVDAVTAFGNADRPRFAQFRPCPNGCARRSGVAPSSESMESSRAWHSTDGARSLSS